MRRIGAMVSAALMLLCMAAGSAQAQERLSVRRADGIGESVSMWEKSNGQKYLFLPAYMEGQTLVLHYEDIDSVRLGEMDLTNDSQTDAVAADATLTLLRGNREESLIVMQSENLPAIHIRTESGSLDYIHEKKGNQERGFMTIVTADGTVNFEGEVEKVKGHGNATFVYDKKSYQIKLDKKTPLLGMESGKSYVLLANQHENSLLRNRITLELAREVGLPFTSECRSVDLYVNEEYRGSYLLCDKVTISSGSVDIVESKDEIEDLNDALIKRGITPDAYGSSDYAKGTHKGIEWPREPEDVTGGYLFELEYSQRYADEVSGVVTQRGQAVVVKEPEMMTVAQGEYAAALLESFERAIFAPDGVDSETGRHYTQMADLDSLVRKYMIEEISKNYDANKSSQYFFKDSDAVDPLIYAGPVWDYDSAWGNYAREGTNLSAADPDDLSVAEGGFDYSWWPALAAQPDFAEAVQETWAEVYCPLLHVLTGEWAAPADCGIKTLDAYAQELEASANMNFVRWRVLNHSSRAVKTGATYGENIEYLREWIKDRAAYLDTRWGTD